MASFSRGLCAHVLSFSTRPLCHHIVPPLPARIPCHGRMSTPRQLFSTIRSLQAPPTPSKSSSPVSPKQPSTPARPPPTKSSPTKPIPSTTTRFPPPSPAYAALLASKPTPTLLYEAPNQFWFTFSAFNAGAFCISYVGVQYYTIFLAPPAGLAWWVPHSYAVICGFMAAIGIFWIRWPSRIVRSISAVPVAPAASASTAAAAAATLPRVDLELTTRRWVPFLPAKTTRCRLDEVRVPARVAALVQAATTGQPAGRRDRPSPRERLLAAKAEEERKAAARQYELDHVMTAPFRHFGRGARAAFRGMTRALTREGFAKLKVGKQELKLDVKGGWFLEEGRALDRLVHVGLEEK